MIMLRRKKKYSLYTKKKYLYARVWFLYNKYTYGCFGIDSVIYRPQKITNKKHIHIGHHVSFDKDLRMEAICSKEKQTFSPHLKIGSYTHAEQRCQIFCANSVNIGRHVIISSDVYITDVFHEYSDIKLDILEQPLNAGITVIGDYCFIGTGVKIIKPVHIGTHAIIGANSVVVKDIPSYCVVAGNPARIIKKYNFQTDKWEPLYTKEMT